MAGCLFTWHDLKGFYFFKHNEKPKGLLCNKNINKANSTALGSDVYGNAKFYPHNLPKRILEDGAGKRNVLEERKAQICQRGSRPIFKDFYFGHDYLKGKIYSQVSI